MHGQEIFRDLAVVLWIALGVLLLIYRFRREFNPITGLIIGGATVSIIGPAGFGLFHGHHSVYFAQELGLYLILFVAGIHFSLERLIRMWQLVIIGGAVQIVLTTIIGAIAFIGFAQFVGLEWHVPKAIVAGVLVALSSTALGLPRLQARKKQFTSGGKLVVGTLLSQDMALLPISFLLPILAGKGDGPVGIAMSLFLGVFVLTVAFAFQYKLAPKFLKLTLAAPDKVPFKIGVAALCVTMIWIAMWCGVSGALGMFLAGVIVSHTLYGHEVQGMAENPRDLCVPIFFVSVGMLINWRFLLQDTILQWGVYGTNALLVAITIIGLIVLLFMTGILAAMLLGYPLRTACRVSGYLAQVGELSFILAAVALSLDLLTDQDYDVFIAIAVGTMLLSEPVFRFGLWISEHVPDFAFYSKHFGPLGDEDDELIENAVIIAGYGLAGWEIANGLKPERLGRHSELDSPIVVIETEEDRYERAKQDGHYAWWADATKKACWQDLNVETARAVFLTFEDVARLTMAITLLREKNPKLPIHVRVDRKEHLDELRATFKDDDNLDVTVNEVGSAEIMAGKARRVLGLSRR